ncbi:MULTISPECIES: Na/Pi cotransporter family protein [Campylobacter]|uniref:Na+/Pi-cotransporter n=1 Tax=Campylobacter porcelli TaxID=1660073 RepID=A0A1X9SVD1_9BACT|nr:MULTISPECIES: Na/Pi symporter [unclassified Campylobacter]MCR8679194.1 Na/Pi symporter [Campylobacter sp. RM19072]MCR8696700.1 Na/Pi symporter [Campylobacter sp. RM19073]MEE3705157.1 Na/Pi symporter [Campylobacter sp. CX2-8023-23]MEE3744778.1 Na/Pi symporter [Campylobacter sp. CX2-4855-23]MEE3777102.1 Na/Pi symporter [Campylobacter sp. CX2-4080-23]
MKNILFFSFIVLISILMYISQSFLTIIFGVCIFLYAMSVLEKSFSMMASLETFLKKMTKTNFQSFIFGSVSTTIMQSSGLVSVLAISFLSAGLISLASGLAIIYGINLATITTGWFLAGFGVKVDIAAYSMPLIVIGMLCMVNKTQKIKGFGYFLFSIGLLFLGISYMKGGFDHIKDSIDLSQFAMSGIGGLLIYTLVGVVVTVLIQSSHASLTLAIAALSVGQITYENAVGIAIGSNVGSTVMAVIGSLNANIEGKKLTVAHVLFNVSCAIISIILITPFMYITDITSDYFGIAKDDYTLRLAVFLSYFNAVGVIIFYPLIPFIEKLLNKFMKDSKKRSKIDSAKYLDEHSLQFPNSALEVLNKEMLHLYSNANSIIAKAISISSSDIQNSDTPAKDIIALRQTAIKIDYDELYNNRFKEIYSQIIDYAILAGANAKPEQLSKFMDIRRSALIMAETLKDMKNAQPNIYKYITSSNQYAKEEYDKLRVEMLQSLRIMYKIANIKDPSELENQIKNLRKIYQEYDSEFNFDVLIINKKITNKMATSLMNDTALMKNITKGMLKVVEMIFTHHHSEEKLEEITNA